MCSIPRKSLCNFTHWKPFREGPVWKWVTGLLCRSLQQDTHYFPWACSRFCSEYQCSCLELEDPIRVRGWEQVHWNLPGQIGSWADGEQVWNHAEMGFSVSECKPQTPTQFLLYSDDPTFPALSLIVKRNRWKGAAEGQREKLLPGEFAEEGYHRELLLICCAKNT